MATEEHIIFYGFRDIIKKFEDSNIKFINILYIFILVNNFYIVSRLCNRGYDINMKYSGETTFLVNNKVDCLANINQGKYIMQFVDLIPKLYTLAKAIKNITI